jgi:hypothetical protein
VISFGLILALLLYVPVTVFVIMRVWLKRSLPPDKLRGRQKILGAVGVAVLGASAFLLMRIPGAITSQPMNPFAGLVFVPVLILGVFGLTLAGAAIYSRFRG